MSKHTPGPWYANKMDSHQGLVSSEVDGTTIAITMASKDAALVAAAPELLESLERIIDYWKTNSVNFYQSDLATDAITAIRKAKGEA